MLSARNGRAVPSVLASSADGMLVEVVPPLIDPDEPSTREVAATYSHNVFTVHTAAHAAASASEAATKRQRLEGTSDLQAAAEELQELDPNAFPFDLSAIFPYYPETIDVYLHEDAAVFDDCDTVREKIAACLRSQGMSMSKFAKMIGITPRKYKYVNCVWGYNITVGCI
jgi:hypothetical protein